MTRPANTSWVDGSGIGLMRIIESSVPATVLPIETVGIAFDQGGFWSERRDLNSRTPFRKHDAAQAIRSTTKAHVRCPVWLIDLSLVTIMGLPPKDPHDDDDENEEDEEDEGEEDEEPAAIREPDEQQRVSGSSGLK